MSNFYTPFRYDYVGSFLRPESVKEAKKQFEECDPRCCSKAEGCRLSCDHRWRIPQNLLASRLYVGF